MRILISGGPGSGCTSTASAVGAVLNVPTFDSDDYFHKPTTTPFQEQYTPDERRELLSADLASESSWILSGSIATWGLNGLNPTHGIFLEIPKDERLRRLEYRQRAQFGERIDPLGDMEKEHESFLKWAADYEERIEFGRNLTTDRAFLESNCKHFETLTEVHNLQIIVSRIVDFVARTNHPE